jgi:hypothetical protein
MNIGSVDPNFTGSRALAGPEIQPTIGSGNIWYTQAGILLPTKQTNQSSRTTFGAFTYKNFDALDKSSTI